VLKRYQVYSEEEGYRLKHASDNGVVVITLSNEEDYANLKGWSNGNHNDKKENDLVNKSQENFISELKNKFFSKNRKTVTVDKEEKYLIKDCRMGETYRVDRKMERITERKNRFMEFKPRVNR